MPNVIIISSKKDKNSFLEDFLSFWLIKENFRVEVYERNDDFIIRDEDIIIILQDDGVDGYINCLSRKNYTVLLNFYYNGTVYELPNFCNVDVRIKEWVLDEETIPSSFNYTCIDDFKKEILNIIKTKTKKYINLINPGSVTAYDINKFYGNIYKIDNEKKIFTSNKNLRDISDDFSPLNYEKKVNIYIPVYYRPEKTKKCIDSIKKLAQNSAYDVKIYVGDNNTKLEEMKKFLKECGLYVYFSEKNIGKASIVNHLHKNARKCDYIFSIDGDMYYDHSLVKKEYQKYNIFDRMIECLEKTDQTGLVSSFQYVQSEHWFNGTIKIIKEKNFNIGITNTGIGIAGGCIVMRSKDWKNIGGYKENHDIYTGDDSILTYNVKRHLNKKCAVLMDLGMVHPRPEEEEKGYTEWKRKSWMRDNVSFIKDNYKGSNTKGYYD